MYYKLVVSKGEIVVIGSHKFCETLILGFVAFMKDFNAGKSLLDKSLCKSFCDYGERERPLSPPKSFYLID